MVDGRAAAEFSVRAEYRLLTEFGVRAEDRLPIRGVLTECPVRLEGKAGGYGWESDCGTLREKLADFAAEGDICT